MAQHGQVVAAGNSVTSLTSAVSIRRIADHRLVGGLLVAVTASGAAVRRTV
jgi:hypothetical protein